jgi:hypothetical protein
VDISRVLNRNAGASGNTLKATIVDMQGFDTCTFIIAYENVLDTAVVTAKVAQGPADDTAQMVVSDASIARTATATSMDNKLQVIEVVEPAQRFLELQVAIATANAPIDSIVCIRSNASARPRTQGATVVDSGTFLTPEAA